MECELLEPIGARIRGLSVRDFDPADAEPLKALLADRGVLILPEQATDDGQFVRFLGKLGDLTFTEGETAVEGHPDLNLVSNVGRSEPPRSSFHVDTSYISEPPAYTALRAVEIPEHGGATEFANQYRSYETLPEEVRSRLEGRTITHVLTGLELDGDAETSAEHPIFRPHPSSGRIALYMSTPKRCAAISGLDGDEAERTIDYLYEHSTLPENVLRHHWSAGDVVIWDNACVLHRADHSEVVGDRVMHRGMVAHY